MMEEEYSNVRAPQYLDFTESTSPQMSTPDFFEKVHKMHERKETICDSTFENAENADPQHALANDKMYLKVQEENIIKNTPIKVIISPPCRGKAAIEQFTTCDKVLSEAMKKLDFCNRLHKTQDLSKIGQEPTGGFKTPITTKLVKSSRSVGCRSLPHKGVLVGRQETRSVKKISKNLGTSIGAAKKQSVSLSLFNEENRTQNVEPRGSTDDVKPNETKCDNNKEKTCDDKNIRDEDEKHNVNIIITEETNEKHDATEGDELDEETEFKNKSEESGDDNKQQQDEDILQQPGLSGKSVQSAKVLTWKNHRRISMDARRMSVSKKYVSMAEAVSRFQNTTPKRFHTKSIKDNNIALSRQSHLRTTIPISPALVTKNRTRPVKVLSRDEKEMLELEEMKKNRIKANPIPRSVMLARRSNAVTKSSTSLNTQPAETVRSRSPLRKSEVVLATTVTRVDVDGIVARRREISSFGVPSMTKNVTRVKPFGLETRNKDLQKKKEERLKNLQEAVKPKHPEFHAKPAPNFSKPSKPAGTSHQQTGRKMILPRPFSFDERDKLIPKKKEQKIKELLEEEKRSRVFRANPAPFHKPVLQQEESSKVTTNATKAGTSHEDEREDQKERNVVPAVPRNTADCSDKQKKAAPPLTKRTSSFELYTDKRARERREFEEKLKRKEMEEEAMRLEQQKKQEEHDRRMRAEMRKLAEVKARPMPAFKTPVILKHTKPLTNPQSPAFASKRTKQQ
ncbi:targeting protein for Xklp2 homolog [Pseudomyrmex gracilis]|uniref:targeting protein for Xklp2 homolog n=1 Tax=Pseudomyrmex gracilis TaxID=219809 RepID=UPI000995D0BE|nr:targeting protein for Xklp2 homolog [Pseudomyrmex gracilis]